MFRCLQAPPQFRIDLTDSDEEEAATKRARLTAAAPICELRFARRIREDLDIWVIPRFAQQVLGFDPAGLMLSLQRYPTVGKDDCIEPHVVQWVSGENKALSYRGRPVKRTKIWLQRGDPEAVGIRRYLYTGWSWNIAPATADVASCLEVLNVADAYDAWVQQEGYPKANHYIVTEYVDGDHHIGFHYDKPRSIAAASLITVVKTGAHGRPFQLRDLVRARNDRDEDLGRCTRVTNGRCSSPRQKSSPN